MGFKHDDFTITNEEIDQRVYHVDDIARAAIASGDPRVLAAAQLQATAATHDMLGQMLKWMKERR